MDIFEPLKVYVKSQTESPKSAHLISNGPEYSLLKGIPRLRAKPHTFGTFSGQNGHFSAKVVPVGTLKANEV